MESRSARSCVFRPRLRTLLLAAALVGLLLAVVVREARFRAELQRERERAEANFQKARAVVDQYLTRVAEQSAVPGPRNDKLRREILERSLKFSPPPAYLAKPIPPGSSSLASFSIKALA